METKENLDKYIEHLRSLAGSVSSAENILNGEITQTDIYALMFPGIINKSVGLVYNESEYRGRSSEVLSFGITTKPKTTAANEDAEKRPLLLISDLDMLLFDPKKLSLETAKVVSQGGMHGVSIKIDQIFDEMLLLSETPFTDKKISKIVMNETKLGDRNSTYAFYVSSADGADGYLAESVTIDEEQRLTNGELENIIAGDPTDGIVTKDRKRSKLYFLTDNCKTKTEIESGPKVESYIAEMKKDIKLALTTAKPSVADVEIYVDGEKAELNDFTEARRLDAKRLGRAYTKRLFSTAKVSGEDIVFYAGKGPVLKQNYNSFMDGVALFFDGGANEAKKMLKSLKDTNDGMFG